jgi:hypothetical protein
VLKSSGVRPYEPTAEDRVWLSRAVAAEGEPKEQVARALVNLFMLQRQKGNPRTLTQLVRAYAQPVNPAWYPDGERYLSAPRTEVERRAAVRRRDVLSTRMVFGPDVRRAVLLALETPFTSDVTDYAAPSIDGAAKGYAPRSDPKLGENRFWSRAPGWAGYAVASAGALVPLLALLALVVGIKGVR